MEDEKVEETETAQELRKLRKLHTWFIAAIGVALIWGIVLYALHHSDSQASHSSSCYVQSVISQYDPTC